MSRRERFDRKRGRHKKRTSRETARWEREHLIPPCPPWMAPSTYQALARLRETYPEGGKP
jgi:hypothetical protein